MKIFFNCFVILPNSIISLKVEKLIGHTTDAQAHYVGADTHSGFGNSCLI